MDGIIKPYDDKQKLLIATTTRLDGIPLHQGGDMSTEIIDECITNIELNNTIRTENNTLVASVLDPIEDAERKAAAEAALLAAAEASAAEAFAAAEAIKKVKLAEYMEIINKYKIIEDTPIPNIKYFSKNGTAIIKATDDNGLWRPSNISDKDDLPVLVIDTRIESATPQIVYGFIINSDPGTEYQLWYTPIIVIDETIFNMKFLTPDLINKQITLQGIYKANTSNEIEIEKKGKLVILDKPINCSWVIIRPTDYIKDISLNVSVLIDK
jgi:hypothetical protein